MNSQRSSLAALALLVLLACVVAAGARPSADAAKATQDAFLATCPHVLHTLATPEQISGSWYMYEFVLDSSRSSVEPSAQMACLRYDIGVEGTQITLATKLLVNGHLSHEQNFTYSLAPSGRWQGSNNEANESFFAGLSSDGQLLVICGDNPTVAAVVVSTALGRVPTAAAAERLEALRRPPAPQVRRMVLSADLAQCTPTPPSQ